MKYPDSSQDVVSAWAEISSTFHRLSQLGSDTERQEMLAALSRENPELAAEMQSLLVADNKAGAILLESDSADAASGWSCDSRYLLVREIGRGGMGIVYLARRVDQEYDQYVAIKLSKVGMDTDAIIRRFLQERQILAELSHPNIARLLDGGTTADGYPYLVMEYIAGDPITLYCDRNSLSLRQRLELFLQICRAVQYAHQRWIVHRDLKASNILVTAQGVPVLLDFGTAKLLEPTHPDRPTTVTRTADRWLTLATASPEQVRGELVTAATDVYGLGTLLYELLTGSSPHQFHNQSPEEILRVLCEAEPILPSLSLDPHGTAGKRSPQDVERMAHARGTSPTTLRRALAGDLDAIVIKALQKDPAQRFESVDRLADDIRRHLDRKPIRARRLTFLYRTRKAISRHRRTVATATVVIIMTADLLLWVLSETRRTARQREIAETQRTNAEQVSGFLAEVFEGTAFDLTQGETPNTKTLIDNSVSAIRQRFSNHPEVQAMLLTSLSATYRKMGDYVYAGALLEGALAEYRVSPEKNDPTIARIKHEQGRLQMELGQYSASRALFESSLRIRQAAFGRQHAKTVESMLHLAEVSRLMADFRNARLLATEAMFFLAEAGSNDHRLYARCLTVLGWLDLQAGRHDLAVPRLEEALRIQERRASEPAAVTLTRASLAMAYQASGDAERATELLQHFPDVLSVEQSH